MQKSMAFRLAMTVIASATLALPGCDRIQATDHSGDEPTADAPFEWPTGPHPVVTLEVTEPEAARGEIVIELYPELAPKTVESFLDLASKDFFDGTTFHRVLPGFMIQGGDPNSKDMDPDNDGQGGPDYKLVDEFNPAPHLRGTVSMANTGRPDSAGSQFFIVQEDARDLDGRYTAFGRVVRGMDVVDRIAKSELDLVGRWGPKNRPLEKVVIGDVLIDESAPDADAAEAGAIEGEEGTSGAGVVEEGSAGTDTSHAESAALDSWSADEIDTAAAEIMPLEMDSPRATEP